MTLSLLTTPILAFWLTIDAAWPAWAIVLAVAALVALIGWTYGGHLWRSRRTMLMASLRMAAAVTLLLILLRPTLIVSHDYTPRPLLTVAVDTSASMARADVSPAGSQGTSPTRLTAAAAGLSDREGALLVQLLRDYDVQLAAVADGVVSRQVLTDRRQVPEVLQWLNGLQPEARRTDLAESIQQILASAEPNQVLAGIVLVSDGRRNSGAPLHTTAEQLFSLGCPAIAVAAGNDQPLPDLQLADVEVPPRAFVDEPVAIRGRLEATGISQDVKATVKLLDEPTGKVLSERTISLTPDGPAKGNEFSLMYRPDKPGLARLLVKAESPVEEVNLRNNQSAWQVEAVSAKVRVLYVDHDARFEYRYLKNLLMREPMIVSSCLLLSADPEFPQEGTEPIRRFPTSLEDLDRYDVILLGDVDPYAGWITPQGLDNLAQWVESKGGGLAWLAGSRSGVQAWRDTPLGKLLPVRPASQAAATQPAAQGYRPVLTAEGLRSSIFYLDPKADPGAASLDKVIEQLPEWHWAAAVGPATPAAQALAMHPRMRTADGPVPVLVTGRYGAGQTLYCGSDDIWRWRRYRDIEHWRSFWLQSIRWLAGPRKLGAYRPVALEASPARVLAGQPVNLNLQVRDARLAENLPERVSVTLRQTDGDAVQSLWLQRSAEQATFSGSASLDRAGTYTAQAQVAGAAPATATLAVQLAESESADTPADPAALRRWVQAVQEAGGVGHTIELDHLEQLATLSLPQATTRTQVMDIRLWDNWLALLLVSGLFLGEWAWRRSKGLA